MADANDDILYMRQLAEQGRHGLIYGGQFLGVAGVVFGIACVLQWAISTGQLATEWQAYLWPASFVLYAVLWLALFLRVRAHGGVKVVNASQHAFGTVWIACAIGIAVGIASIALVGHVTGNSVVVNLYAPLVFSFYGAAWCGVAILAKRRWMYAVAAASFVFALILAALAGNTLLLLVEGIALLVTLAAPGFKLALDAPC